MATINVLLEIPVPDILPLLISVVIIISVYLFSIKRTKALKIKTLAQEAEILKYKELLQYAEDSKEQAIKEADKNVQTNRQLIAKLCRDIRTSMNSVVGMNQLLSQTELNTEQRDMSKAIRDSSSEILQTINDAAKGDGSEFLKTNLVHQQGKQASVNAKEVKIKNDFNTDFATAYPLKILVAEDDAINRQIATRIFGKLGYKPDIVENGKEALEIVGDKPYDIVFMDLVMPEMDGLEATRMIRLCLDTQPIIIAMTASALEGDQEKCIQAGMNDYISKPVLIDQLVKMVEKWGVKETAAAV